MYLPCEIDDDHDHDVDDYDHDHDVDDYDHDHDVDDDHDHDVDDGDHDHDVDDDDAHDHDVDNDDDEAFRRSPAAQSESQTKDTRTRDQNSSLKQMVSTWKSLHPKMRVRLHAKTDKLCTSCQTSLHKLSRYF